MDLLLNIIQGASYFLWGFPITIALVGTGIYLTLKFKFHFENTYAQALKKVMMKELFLDLQQLVLLYIWTLDLSSPN